MCFHCLSYAISTSEGLVKEAYEESLVVKLDPESVKPDGLRGPRARCALTPLTNNCLLWVPAVTEAR